MVIGSGAKFCRRRRTQRSAQSLPPAWRRASAKIDEARREWQELLRVNPNYSVEHRRKVLPSKTPVE